MKNKNILLVFTVIAMQINTISFSHISPSLQKSIQAIILAAGQGSRLKTGITKMITPICGQPMVLYPVNLMQQLSFPITVVIGYQKEAVQSAVEKGFAHPISFAEQVGQHGTGHALVASKSTWQSDNILVINGDMPLLSAQAIEALAQVHFANSAAISIITSYNVDPANAFGRVVNENGITKVIEKKHFNYDIKDYPYVNAGIYLISRSFLESYLDQVKQNETTHEFYITDLVELASKNSLPVVTQPWSFDTLYGVNTFQELSQVEKIKHDEIINYWMAQGVRFISPETTHIDVKVKIGRGTVINPGVQLLAETQVGEFVTIGAHAVINNATIGDRSNIGANSVIEHRKISVDEVVTPCSYLK